MYYPKLKNQFEYLKQKTKVRLMQLYSEWLVLIVTSDASHLQVQSA